ncbi:hypothetical protein IW492_14985 [Enterococcus sp. BWB1-3]|uniref:hypothetical protein n=1 Tax=Enterococcus sp. BWB1-3 TaxID=2787713 RepID=UPI001921E1DC|nr:hypothetical protein [Enterococcus sp. BWB1-3]MBL1230534.1 hypothetical protein [Enterococcus sp. BWB1-3]
MKFYQIKGKMIREQVVTLNSLPKDYRSIDRQQGIEGCLNTLFPEMLTDYVADPYPIISDEFLKVIQIYQPKLSHKFVTLKSRKNEEIPHYWALQPKLIDCLHTETKLNDKRGIEELVLKIEPIRYHHFFAVRGLKEGQWIASLEVMESLLRRGLNGFTGKAVIVK